MSEDGVEGGRLVVCPTPIGNLRDVTLRVLDVLGEADVIACEDTRRTRTLLERHGLDDPRPELVSCHEHNERERARELAARVTGGEVVALVTDAGTPLVSDPGYAVLAACLAAGAKVEVLPGPTAAVTALVASGMAVSRWMFVGFLPRGSAQLARLLGEATETVVAFESPRRLAATLAALAEHDPRRSVAVCRELTKLHEEVRRGPAREVADHYRTGPTPRGEVVMVIAGATPDPVDASGAGAALAELVATGARARAAAGVVSRLTGVPANELYRGLIEGD